MKKKNFSDIKQKKNDPVNPLRVNRVLRPLENKIEKSENGLLNHLSQEKNKLLKEVWQEEQLLKEKEADKKFKTGRQKTFLKRFQPAKGINLLTAEQGFQLRLKAWRRRKVPHQLAVFGLMILVVFFILKSAAIVARTLDAKPQVLGATTEALSQLKEAQDLTQQKQFTDSANQFQLAEKSFVQSKNQLISAEGFLSSVVGLTPQGRDANSLLDAGQQIAKAGTDLNNFYAVASAIKVTPQGFEAPDGFYETLNVAQNYLKEGSNYLNRADQDLSGVRLSSLPLSFQSQFSQYASQITEYSRSLSQISELVGLLQNFVGPGNKSFLILFENNNELRPGGGFIGTYGFYHLSDGKIISQKISSVYDLDGQLNEKIAPPGQFHDLTDQWGLRDSNWFIDFKESAQKASIFYEKEGGETPDAVIALTPDIFVDLLKVTGPIFFPKYNVTLSADNFRTVVQLDTSSSTDTQQNAPKQMLADFAPFLLQNLFSKTGITSYGQVFITILDNLNKKNIVFYDRKPSIQNQFESYNWGGTIADTDRDYLSVVSANLGGKKTDLNISQNVKLESQVQTDGSVIDTLTYVRAHAPVLTDPVNHSYLRFLVPAGSQLLASSGFNAKPFYRSDGSAYTFEPTVKFVTDPDLINIDNSARIDATSGTVITSESGKTAFGNWLDLAEGQSRTAVLKYKLPFNLSQTRKDSLLVQKQPGALPINFEYDLTGAHKFLWYSRLDLQVDDQTLSLKQTLNEDLFLGLVLDK